FRNWTPISERSSSPWIRTRPARAKPYSNGLWLYAPDAGALAAPHLDFLIEKVTEESRQEIAEGVMEYRFQNRYGRIRVTTDVYGVEGGVSAWWFHADSAENLFELARPVLWMADLRSKLRHWTKATRPVRDRLREAEQGA